MINAMNRINHSHDLAIESGDREEGSSSSSSARPPVCLSILLLHWPVQRPANKFGNQFILSSQFRAARRGQAADRGSECIYYNYNVDIKLRAFELFIAANSSGGKNKAEGSGWPASLRVGFC